VIVRRLGVVGETRHCPENKTFAANGVISNEPGTADTKLAWKLADPIFGDRFKSGVTSPAVN